MPGTSHDVMNTGLLVIGGYNNNTPLPTAELAQGQSSAGGN